MKEFKQLDLPIPEFSLETLEKKAIETLKLFKPKNEPYYGCFSGGKDSCVIKELAKIANISVEWYYNVTTIDPPELIKFMRKEHPDVKWKKSKYGNFFKRMLVQGPPTRIMRWCCREFKETSIPNHKKIIMGIRVVESTKRALTWKVVHKHWKSDSIIISPILFWRDKDVWNYIRKKEIAYCDLYDEGFTRLGCIGCPMGRRVNRVKQFARWPKFEKLYKRNFEKLWNERSGTVGRKNNEWFGSAHFSCWEEMWEWWLSDNSLPSDDCLGLLDLMS